MQTENQPLSRINPNSAIDSGEKAVILSSGKEKKKKIIGLVKIILLALVDLLILSILIRIGYERFIFGKKPVVSPSPSPSVLTPTPKTGVSQSPSASDSAVLAIEADLQQLDKNLQETNFREPSLLPPQIKMDVRFEVQE